MPYQCISGDAEPVIVVLQKMDDDYAQEPFCATCWAQFIAAAGRAMFGPFASENAATTESTPAGQDGDQGADQGDGPDTQEMEPVTVPAGAATTDQRPDAGDPAPF